MSGQGESSRKTHRNKEQEELLTELLSKTPKMVSGKFEQNFTYKDYIKKWEELAQLLNSVPGGAQKDWKGWRKTWQDKKSRTKKKVSAGKIAAVRTGGGVDNTPQLTDTEEKIFNLIKPVSILGQASVMESSVHFVDTETAEIIDIQCEEPENSDSEGANETKVDLGNRHTSVAESQTGVAVPSLSKVRSKQYELPKKKSKASEIACAVEHLKSITTEGQQSTKSYQDEKLYLKREKLKKLDNIISLKERKCAAIEKLASAVENFAENIS